MDAAHSNPQQVVTVWDGETRLDFSIAECMKYHGPIFPGGVAHAFAAMGRALPELASRIPGGKLQRREIIIRTAFGGPGGRDAMELVTRAVTGDRFEVLPELARPERGSTLARYVFEFSAGGHTVTCAIRDEGIVVDEFIQLGLKSEKTAQELERIEVLKAEMRDRILSREPSGVYDLEG